MKTKLIAGIVAVTAVIAILFISKEPKKVSLAFSEKEAEKEAPARFVEARMKYEFDMVKDPVTGKIPKGIYEQELAFAKTLPVRASTEVALSASGSQRTEALNSYIPAGPNNIGGRTRAIAYDVRYNGSTNKVIIAGCVSGGIMRSIDGGTNWTLVTLSNDIHNFTAIAQDPRAGFQDTWYAGGGEFSGNSASEFGAIYYGYGIWKSTDNGVNWTKLTLTVTDISDVVMQGGVLEAFDNVFDFVHAIAVNPVNGDVYIAGHRRIVRSTDGGASFKVVFASTVVANTLTGQMDVTVSNAGRVYLAVNGGNPDASLRGVWYSASGNANSFTRIAGGSVIGVDSVADWRGNDYKSDSKRILITLAPSNNNIAYVYYENGLSSASPNLKPEADLYRLDVSGTTFTWSNRSANMPDFPGGNLTGSDPLTVQGGYDMLVKVMPDNPNTVFISGTNLYRSTDGFASTTNTSWIGGYKTDFTYGQYPNSHADVHQLAFNPANFMEAVCGNDGGVQLTTNITAAVVSWKFPANYQTLQYYNVAIDPVAGDNNFAGGSQDNGVRFRDKTGLLGTPAADSNNHRLLFSADGAYVGISSLNGANQYIFESIQLGRLYRAALTTPFGGTVEITPAGLTTSSTTAGPNEFGEFVTNLRLVADNSEDLYYVNFNRLFRTTSASTVTSSTWTELTGVAAAINPANPIDGRNIAIRGLGFSRGPYATSHTLYIGTTNGKIFRLDDPRNTAATTTPINITPTGLTGNVQDIAVNPNNDDEVMAVVSNYNAISIWRTTNGKSAIPTWVNIEGNLTLPSVRSCVIVVKKDAANLPVTEYYVGTSVGLYSTTNINAGSTTWQREGASMLNFAVVQSMAYRPADNVMVIGTHGNGMYYTFLGTPNFIPNQNTAVDPVTNDKNFIKKVFPTMAFDKVNYQTGNMFGVKKLTVQVTDLSGKIVYRKETGYISGSIPLNAYASGIYILSIYSDDNKFRHIQKIIKQ